MAGPCFPQSGPQASPGYITWPENEKGRKKEIFPKIEPSIMGARIENEKVRGKKIFSSVRAQHHRCTAGFENEKVMEKKNFFLRLSPASWVLGLKMRKAKR